MENFRKVSGHCYHVANQNGFNNALYDFYNENGNKEAIRKMVQNYPKYYPTTIIIIDQSFECNRLYIEQIDMSKEAHQLPSFFNNPIHE